MSGEKEVLRYELDVTDVEAKAARLQQLLADLKAKSASGEDTSELERQISVELDELGRLAQAKKKDSSATEDLIRQKEKLGNVVAVAGGQFGGMISAIGGAVEAITRFGKAGAVVAIVIGAFTAVAKAVEHSKNKVMEATKALVDYNRKVDELQGKKLGTAGALGEELAKYGLATPQNVNAAQRLNDELRRQYGMDDTATVAMAIAAGGKSVEDVAVLAMMRRREEGGPASSGEARKALEKARETGTYADTLSQAQRFAATPGAVEARAMAMGPGQRGTAGRPAQDIAWGQLQAAGLVSEEVSRIEFDDARVRAERARSKGVGWWGWLRRTGHERENLERWKQFEPYAAAYDNLVKQIDAVQRGGGKAGATLAPELPVGPDTVGEFLEGLSGQRSSAGRNARGPILMPTPEAPLGLTTGGASIEPAPVVSNHYTTNIGTQHNVADRRNSMRGRKASIHPSGADMRAPG